MGKFPYTSKCQKRLKPQGGFTMRIHQSVSYQNAILIVLEHHFLFQHNSAYTINRCRHFVTIKFANVLMPLRTVVVALVLMQAKVELRTMLDYGDIHG